MLGKRSNTKQLDYIALILNYFKNTRVRGSIGHIQVSIFEASNWVVARGLS